MCMLAGAAAIAEFKASPVSVRENYPGAENMLSDLSSKITAVSGVSPTLKCLLTFFLSLFLIFAVHCLSTYLHGDLVPHRVVLYCVSLYCTVLYCTVLYFITHNSQLIDCQLIFQFQYPYFEP